MSDDPYGVWEEDAKLLAAIGRSIFGQRTRVTVRLPRDLADRALAAWRREEGDGRPLPPGTREQRAVRHKAAAVGLIGLSIENGFQPDGDEVVVELDAWQIGDAYNAADDAGLLRDVGTPNT
jgi:hypothetical protein